MPLQPLSVLIPSFIVLVLSLSFHEAAHAWTADRLGDPTARRLGRVSLNPLVHIDWIGTVLLPIIAAVSNLPLIGWAKPVPVDPRNLRHPQRDFAIVAVAGPMSNLVLATGAAIARALVSAANRQPGPIGDQLEHMLLLMVLINVLLAVFNMIPVPPLDGGNVAIGVLPAPLANAVARLRPWGFLVLYGLMFSGVLWWITEPVSNAILNWLL